MLAIEGLGKTYEPPRVLLRPLVRGASDRPVTALRDVSFSVGPGRVVGLVGPNGAGKTTLIRIVAGVLSPTSGSVSVAGFDVVRQEREAKRRIGLVMAEDRSAYWRLTGRANLEFFARLHGIDTTTARARADEALHRVDLAEVDKRVFGYSAGMRSALAMARALLTRPPVLVLDEPTRSLDPIRSASTATLLREVADEGCAVLLSSHRLDEVVALCDDIVVLVGGRVRFSGPPRTLPQGEEGVARQLVDLLVREAEEP
jgi:ABC-2 type transport system ATP-binding protein